MKISKFEIGIHIYITSCVLLSLFVFPLLEKGDFLVWILVLFSSVFAFLGREVTGFMGLESVGLQSILAGVILASLVRGAFYGISLIRK